VFPYGDLIRIEAPRVGPGTVTCEFNECGFQSDSLATVVQHQRVKHNIYYREGVRRNQQRRQR
jgi:hypothetical protein